MSSRSSARISQADSIETPYAWRRLLASLALATIGGVGLWSTVVVLPYVQAEFAVDRADATTPYSATMISFALGGILMGKLADRRGIITPILIGAVAISVGYIAAAQATSLWQFVLAQALLVGLLGSSATFGPLLADVSQWFDRNRGVAMGICASGNYLAGTLWPPVLQHAVAAFGWRDTHIGVGIFCAVTMLPLALTLRRPTPRAPAPPVLSAAQAAAAPTQASQGFLQLMLVLAGFTCCVAMAMPQVHIVAYCGDLGYGPARGAEMLSVMLGTGVISRLASGWISDRIGGIRTLLIGSAMQCLTLLFYLPFDGLMSLYIVSALFGLSQGGIVPSYAMIVRERFPANEAGGRVGLVIMATIVGMAVGGWMSGAIFDLTSSYQAAFLNGILWNLVNVAIAVWLLRKPRPRAAFA